MIVVQDLNVQVHVTQLLTQINTLDNISDI
jgi:hypothetical protein